MYRRDIFAQYMAEAVNGGIKYTEDYMVKCMVFDKKRIKFFDRNVVFYESGLGISTLKRGSTNRKNKIIEATIRDLFNTDDMLLKRCEINPSDLSGKLTYLIIRRKLRQKLKERLGIVSIPLVWVNSILRWIKEMIIHNKYIMTDTNVSTEFANLCINRE